MASSLISMDPSFLTHASLEGHQWSFEGLGIRNNAPVNIPCAGFLVGTSLFNSGYIATDVIAGSYHTDF